MMGMNQKRPTLSRNMPPRNALISVITMVGTSDTKMVVLRSSTSVSMGVATSGKPKPMAPCAKPASSITAATHAMPHQGSARTLSIGLCRCAGLQCLLQHFGNMQRSSSKTLSDLLAAGKTIGHDHGVLAGLAHFLEQALLRRFDR